MNEHEPSHGSEVRPAQDNDAPDWRRLEVGLGRQGERIADGIAWAQAEGREIDDQTARCTAHVLGRAYGRGSALAEFGRTGEGEYPTLRDEYLDLYNSKSIQPSTKELIDWFGTYLVQRENTGSERRFMNEQLPPKLEQLLVATSLRIGGQYFLVHIPASWDSGQVDGLIETLTDLRLPEDDALQAFLALPTVSAGVDDIMQSFDEAFVGTYTSEEHALRVLSPLEEWETGLADWCIDNAVDPEALEWNLRPLTARLRDLYDLVEWKGRIHGFSR